MSGFICSHCSSSFSTKGKNVKEKTINTFFHLLVEEEYTLSFQIHWLNAFGVHHFIFWWQKMFCSSKSKTNLIEKERKKVFKRKSHLFIEIFPSSSFLLEINRFFRNIPKWSFLKANDAYSIKQDIHFKDFFCETNKQTNKKTKK